MSGSIISQVGALASAPLQDKTKQIHRILVVEDDGDVRRLNTEVLLQYGYEVDAVGDGAEAWDALQLTDYDLMITDNRMPKVSGLTLLVRMHAASMSVPVIMATSKLPQQKFPLYPWLQPEATLLRPYTITELLWTVQEVIRANTAASGKFTPRIIVGDEWNFTKPANPALTLARNRVTS